MDESKPEKEGYNGERRRFDPELLKKGLRCDLDQYEMLKRCSDRKDMTEWNEWRMNNPDEDILLEGGVLEKCYLNGAYLTTGPFRDMIAGREGRFYGEVHLEGANLRWAHVENAKLMRARLQKANLEHAWLTGTSL